MPRKQVGQFRGHEVHGSAGEYRYDHVRDDVAVHIHREREPGVPVREQRWAVSVDRGATGAPGAIKTGVTRGGAIRFAYTWMGRNDDIVPDARGEGRVPDARGEGAVDPEFDLGGGL